MKAVEYAIPLGARDSRAVVLDDEAHARGGDSFDGKSHGPGVLDGVLDRVDEQVAQCLGEPVRVGNDRVPRYRTQHEAPSCDQRCGAPQVSHKRLQLESLKLEEILLLGLREQQQVLH